MLYRLNTPGFDFIYEIYYGVKIHYQYFVLVFIHDRGTMLVDILVLNY